MKINISKGSSITIYANLPFKLFLPSHKSLAPLILWPPSPCFKGLFAQHKVNIASTGVIIIALVALCRFDFLFHIPNISFYCNIMCWCIYMYIYIIALSEARFIVNIAYEKWYCCICGFKTHWHTMWSRVLSVVSCYAGNDERTDKDCPWATPGVTGIQSTIQMVSNLLDSLETFSLCCYCSKSSTRGTAGDGPLKTNTHFQFVQVWTCPGLTLLTLLLPHGLVTATTIHEAV